MNWILRIWNQYFGDNRGGIVPQGEIESIKILIDAKPIGTITTYEIAIPGWADMGYSEYQELRLYCEIHKN